MFFKTKRQKYVDAMFKAMEICKKKTALFSSKGVTNTDALRCFRSFEKVNGIKFDPFNSSHIDVIRGNATHEKFFKESRKHFKKWEKRIDGI
jgi:hypothetical protein